MRNSLSVPEKGMNYEVPSQARAARNLSAVVEPMKSRKESADAAKGSQINHPAFVPEKWMLRWDVLSTERLSRVRIRTRVRHSGNLAALIHELRKGIWAT